MINIQSVYKTEKSNYDSLQDFIDAVNLATSARLNEEFIISGALILDIETIEDESHYMIIFNQVWTTEEDITAYDARKIEESIEDSTLETNLNMIITHERL